MRRLRAMFALSGLFSVFFLLSIFLLSILPGCGSGNGVVLITVQPSPPSVNFGQVLQLVPTAYNSKNAVLSSATFTYSSTTPNFVSSTGQVCGGTWDANFITCTPTNTSTQSSVTISSGSISFTTPVYVHPAVTNVQVSVGGQTVAPPNGQPTLPSAACTSTGNSIQLQGAATSNNASVCSTLGLTAPCSLASVLPPNPVQWTSSDTSIVTIDSSGTSTNGTATAVAPGSATILAAVSGTSSPAIPFITCPITSISTTLSSSSPFNPGNSLTMTAVATDSTGATIANPALSWITTQPYVSNIVGQTTTKTATLPPTTASSTSTTYTETVNLPEATVNITASGTATLLASCSPPTCNKNLFPVYSNPNAATATGVPNRTIYAASTGSTVLFPMSSSGGVGTGITLDSAPNSFLFNHQGTKAVLGSSSGVMVFNPNATSTTQLITQVGFNGDGKLLRISTDGALAAVSGQLTGSAQNSIGIINLGTNSLASFAISGTATGADFTPDSRFLWVTATGGGAGPVLYMYATSSGIASSFSLGAGTASDIAFLANGPVGYIAGDGAPANITARATCNQYEQVKTPIDTQTGTAPAKLRSIPNGSGVVALDLPNVDIITVVQSTLSGANVCPNTAFAFDNPLTSINLQQGSSLTPAQFLVTPDSSKAILTSTAANITILNLGSTPTPTTIPLANGATAFHGSTPSIGDVPADSDTFYVGASDGAVHFINLSTGADQLQVNPGFSGVYPDLVAVQNQ